MTEPALTADDVAELKAIVARRKANAGSAPPDPTIPLDHPDAETVRATLADLRDDGLGFTNPRRIAQLTDLTARQAGRVLSALADAGEVEPWGEGRYHGRKYRIDP